MTHKAWYKKNRERLLPIKRAEAAAYRAKNPEEAKAACRVVNRRRHVTARGRAMHLLGGAKRRAAAKKLPFDLTLDWVLPRMGTCEITGLTFVLEPGRGAGQRSAFAPSIDRRILSAGYTQSNCRLIVWGLNAALATWGESDYALIADAYALRR